MQIGKRLTDLRKQFGYTQKELADKLNLSQQVISNIERDATAPDIEFLQGVADLYHISLDELVGREISFDREASFEKRILAVVQSMDETKKELSLRIVSEVAQDRGGKNE